MFSVHIFPLIWFIFGCNLIVQNIVYALYRTTHRPDPRFNSCDNLNLASSQANLPPSSSALSRDSRNNYVSNCGHIGSCSGISLTESLSERVWTVNGNPGRFITMHFLFYDTRLHSRNKLAGSLLNWPRILDGPIKQAKVRRLLSKAPRDPGLVT